MAEWWNITIEVPVEEVSEGQRESLCDAIFATILDWEAGEDGVDVHMFSGLVSHEDNGGET